jgi:hypothetical protein
MSSDDAGKFLPPIIGSMAIIEGAPVERGPARRRQRKPTLARALREASRAGVNVRAATLAPDGGVTLTFGQGATTEVTNPWLADIEKVTKQ